eukprot:gene7965-12431_t
MFLRGKATKKVLTTQKSFKHDLVTNVKFVLSDKNITPKLSEKATLIFEKSSKNVYYDSEDLYLAKKDIWLSQKDGQWECKVPCLVDGLSHVGKQRIPTYSENFGEKSIRRALNLQQDATKKVQISLEDDLKQKKSVVPFAEFDVTTKTYSVSKSITMFVDETSFGYKSGYVSHQLLNAEEDHAEEAIVEITEVLKEYDLYVPSNVNSPITEYIKQNFPERYEALVDAKIIPTSTKQQEEEKEVVEKRYAKKAAKEEGGEEEE